MWTPVTPTFRRQKQRIRSSRLALVTETLSQQDHFEPVKRLACHQDSVWFQGSSWQEDRFLQLVFWPPQLCMHVHTKAIFKVLKNIYGSFNNSSKFKASDIHPLDKQSDIVTWWTKGEFLKHTLKCLRIHYLNHLHDIPEQIRFTCVGWRTVTAVATSGKRGVKGTSRAVVMVCPLVETLVVNSH